MKKSKVLTIILVLIIVILCGVVAFLSLKLYKRNDITPKQEEITNNTAESYEKDETKVENVSDVNQYGFSRPAREDVLVYSYMDLSKYVEHGSAQDTPLKLSVRLPQINSDKAGAVELNKKILKDYEDSLNRFNDESYVAKTSNVKDEITYYYDYSFEDGFMAILVQESHVSPQASGGRGYSSYIYNAKEDREYSTKEFFDARNLPREKLTEEIAKHLMSEESFALNQMGKMLEHNDYSGIFVKGVSGESIIVIVQVGMFEKEIYI